MPEEQAQERTEEATPRRREEARRRGQVVKSRELSSLAILSTGFLSLIFLSFIFFQQFIFITKFSFSSFNLEIADLDYFFHFFKICTKSLLKFLFPYLGLLVISAVVIYLLQTGGGVWATETLGFKFDRLNPVEGFKRLFSLVSLFELLKSLTKLIIIVGIAYWVLSQKFGTIIKLLGQNSYHLLLALKVLFQELMTKMLFILAFLAILDWLYNRWDVERKLRMTRQELKEELKQTEGDPWIKAKIRQKQREMSRQRMLAEVPKADVVITNPEHYAVALKYELGKMSAPVVVAKGLDHLAQKIKEIAMSHGIPIYEDPPLAQILYKKVEVGEIIPQDLYQAVAKVLAYVYKLKKRGAKHA
ncbi:MAG: flagellar biosynthesis protein FlhB [Caldimicrobium sp.]|nr:flagellar biosynthesis protein FlhB [Caldimicrobium sp.]MCX7613596.1 flagellar biosynthesis protein FlhB [Caldimicrobium sp.]MDW8183075.1 flagellar biosynthesis protein FlhB [Caldimicrobium sp.]